MKLTAPQRKVLEFLDSQDKDRYGLRRSVSPRQVARHLWPDSPAWGQRTRFGAVSNQGALGGTMPMNAAQILWRLHAAHLTDKELDANAWWITGEGEEALEESR